MAFKIGKGVQVLPFDEVLSTSAWEYVTELVSLGALVSVGAARDKGAVSVTVTVGGEYDREWFRTEAEVTEWLREAVQVVTQHTSEPSNGSRPRRRP